MSPLARLSIALIKPYERLYHLLSLLTVSASQAANARALSGRQKFVVTSGAFENELTEFALVGKLLKKFASSVGMIHHFLPKASTTKEMASFYSLHDLK